MYEMETKERVALNNSTITVDSSLRNFGQIIIKAPVSGIVTTIDRQQTGEYIMEGNPFCTITRNSDLAFQLNVPYEYHSLVERNRKCAIVLPDKSRIQGRIVKALSALNPVAQTQIYLVAPAGNTFLPEGLVASVLITTNSRPHAQVLPREAVLSDELMKNFWIMKLVNDTTAVKVDITTGISNENEMEIVSPVLSPADRIISEGNYGLADTASVKIIK
ncbi:hypothetical protein CCY01nite_39960 [Chitinophaga cymbidii]|uniref:RND efflux pump membrane fusion protein barrel-sandwich domain-containing protein n=1 Tax=Chitinophaga cymbidii TaxID=1096750 RepID=A0A512RPV8_9BACT|nr:hypothetical protein CCY01nite_39960 [Chitinophaga cymbidii]